jgi:hypothetical protein
MKPLLAFEKNIFPNTRKIYRFDCEKICPQPTNDLHLAVRTIIEKLKDQHLIFEEMIDD